MSDDLQAIPGIGPRIAAKLLHLDIETPGDLRGRDPMTLYADLCAAEGAPVDRCVLYVFRCAVYYAEHDTHEPEHLKWWNWTDDRLGAIS